jgi:hypothetical protein
VTLTDLDLGCSFCTNALTTDMTAPTITPLGPLGILDAPLDPGWKILYTGSNVPTIICPLCLPTLVEVAAALEAGITALLARIQHRATA